MQFRLMLEGASLECRGLKTIVVKFDVMLSSSSLVKVMVAQLWHLFSNCFASFIFVA